MVDLAPPPGEQRAPRPFRRPLAAAANSLRRLTVRRRPVTIRFDRRDAARAVGLYLAVAGLGFAVLLLLSHHLHYPAEHVLRRWDSANYLSIAEHGYPHQLRYRPNGMPAWSTLAFFPLYPALIWLVHLTGLPFAYAAVLVSWAAAAVAAAGVYTLASSISGRRAGYTCVALWACYPYAFALWVPYSEACFSAALIWALVALLARRWLAAGTLAAVAGTLRPTASVVVGVVMVTALRQLVRDRHWQWQTKPVLGALIAPLGLVFSWLYLGAQVGRLDGWFRAEKAWGQSFDFGRGTAHFFKLVATYREVDVRSLAVVALLGLTAVGILTLVLDRTVPWVLILALAGVWVLAVGTPGSPMSKPRFLLPFLPVALLPLAVAVSRLPRLVRGALYCSGALFAGMYAVGLLLRWPTSP
ncbi:hypothetical protein K7472_26925 [Streptomyces sp. PTM05]|uniref:Integral membrane protein n=1 Tax=Streptantibioticus parmotrematis TaxID=2873249 RepID=A0ABS7QZ06_9ACTN|nr:hypothetical protein [Streptantibioticus parmotrematis]MBY8888448.1 hypothetical protein [Streptantibioticus parmotrematis]